jgi:hypothetical protein
MILVPPSALSGRHVYPILTRRTNLQQIRWISPRSNSAMPANTVND